MNRDDNMKDCVMCGKSCPCSGPNNKNKKSDDGNSSGGNKNSSTSKQQAVSAIIPTQNKGLCTSCDVNVWVITQSGLEIKWCKGCKNFRPWAAFGEKGLATKCVRCRERQREKYALQKEEKEKEKELKEKQTQNGTNQSSIAARVPSDSSSITSMVKMELDD